MEYKLGDLIEIKHGYAFKSEDFSEEPTRNILLSPGNVSIGGGFNSRKKKYYREDIEVNSDYVFSNGDIFITMTDLSKEGDTLGYPAKIPENTNYNYLHNQRLGRVILKNEKLIDLDYLYYLLCTREYRGYILGTATGSTVKHTSPTKILDYKINLPELHVQKKVSSILSSLDKKVLVNNKTIELLEQLSQTLFKQWFIHFEFPNDEGEPYKSSGGEMKESDLGNIPKSWTIDNLSSIAEIVMGQSPKSNTYNNEEIGLPLLNGATDFRNRNLSPSKYTSDAKKIGQKGDFVFGVRATIGLVTELDDTYAIGRGSGIAKSLHPEQKEYLYGVLNKAFDEFQYTASGSVYLNVSKNDLMNFKICQPPFDIINKYHQVVNSMMIQKENLKKQNRNLIQLRNILLPKLLSGEIDIPIQLEV